MRLFAEDNDIYYFIYNPYTASAQISGYMLDRNILSLRMCLKKIERKKTTLLLQKLQYAKLNYLIKNKHIPKTFIIILKTVVGFRFQ